jgi:hypothetical protein
MSHDPRCEWSKTPNRRCRCECQGRQHGIQAVRQRVLSEFLEGAAVVGEEPAEEELPHDR